MTTEDAFLQDILARHDDDVVRLIYADWLEEHDHPERAELIRVQIELEQLPDYSALSPEDPDDYSAKRRRDHLMQRQQKLLDGPRFVQWFYRMSLSWRPPWRGVIRRGLLHGVELTAHDWLRHAPWLLSRHPLRQVELTTVPRLTIDWDGRYLGLHGDSQILFPQRDLIGHEGDHFQRLFQLRWPGIFFIFPRTH